MGERKYGELRITLKSDLCVGSGYSYAGIVDSDASYDDCGIPYIPAKRLKGCMRESLEMLLYSKYSEESVQEVFGKRGDSRGARFVLDNGYIRNYEAIHDYLERQKDAVVNAQEILERFAHVVGQTRMTDGVAEEGSLRYTRVINHNSPWGGELVFLAAFSCDEEDFAMIKDAAKATRHIGLKRNRGLGNVAIDVVASSAYREIKDDLILEDRRTDGSTVLSFAVKNVAPLMLSRTMEDETADYISGQQVLGLLASRYLQKKGKTAEDGVFQDLFLNGKTIYANLYPYDGKNVYHPAPDYINRLKKSGTYQYHMATDANIKDGDQPKKLKGKFVSVSDDGISVYEVKKDIIFHHSHRNTHKTENGEESILYSMEAIRSGQMFAGQIVVPEDLAGIIKELLCEEDLFFGKSRTSQYGRCQLAERTGDTVSERAGFQRGEDIVVTFVSDAIFHDRNGRPTVYFDEVTEIVKEALGIEGKVIDGQYVSSIQTTTATGYLRVWNLRKSALPAIRAGSYILYHLESDLHEYSIFIGERNGEGYGEVTITKLDQYQQKKTLSVKPVNHPKTVVRSMEEGNQLMIPILYDRWLERRIFDAISGRERIGVTNTSAGRFALMLRESIGETGGDCQRAFEEFGKRIESFKTGSTREEGVKLLKRAGKKDEDTGVWRLDENKEFFTSDEELKGALHAIGEPDHLEEKINRWEKYVMAILTDRKYKER